MKYTSLTLVLATLAVPLFAVDGQLLINQATVTAAGGFPYRITQPGSYKLSGNLMMTTTASGNSQGSDIAIAIAASNVVLDLNGFSILIDNQVRPPATRNIIAISASSGRRNIAVRNGTVELSAAQYSGNTAATWLINLPGTQSRLEDLTINHAFGPDLYTGGGSALRSFQVGTGAVVRNVVANGLGNVGCASLVNGNVAGLVVNNTIGLDPVLFNPNTYQYLCSNSSLPAVQGNVFPRYSPY